MSTPPRNGWAQPIYGTVPQGHATCPACGATAPVDANTVQRVEYTRRANQNGRPVLIGVRLWQRCAAGCAPRFEAWSPWATSNPGNVRALGGGINPEIAADRAESLAVAAAILGYEGTAGADLLRAAGLMRHPKDGPAFSMRFADHLAEAGLETEPFDRCLTVPWSHVCVEQIAELRALSADTLNAQAGTPRLVPAHDARSVLIGVKHDDDVVLSGCMACGVEAVPIPFPGASASDVWKPYDVAAFEFGPAVHRGSGSGRVHGVLCPSCLPHVEAGHGVGGWLPTSLLADLYGLDGIEQIVNGPALLWAGRVVQERRRGHPEPVASAQPWRHLPRDADDVLIPPRTAREFVPQQMARQTGAEAAMARLARLTPQEADAVIERVLAEPSASTPEPISVDQAKRVLLDAYRTDSRESGWVRF